MPGGRACGVCSHMYSGAIEVALIAEEPLRSIAHRFGPSPPALLRHRQQHMPASTLVARDALVNRNPGDARQAVSHVRMGDAPTIQSSDAGLDSSSDDWGIPDNAGVVTPAAKTTQRPTQPVKVAQAHPNADMTPTINDMAALIALAEPAPVAGPLVEQQLEGAARADDGWYAKIVSTDDSRDY
jgi:hypothetical protein